MGKICYYRFKFSDEMKPISFAPFTLVLSFHLIHSITACVRAFCSTSSHSDVADGNLPSKFHQADQARGGRRWTSVKGVNLLWCGQKQAVDRK